jgi:hypothetical protein
VHPNQIRESLKDCDQRPRSGRSARPARLPASTTGCARFKGEDQMKTFVVLLCFIATTAHAAPLYLKCEGKLFHTRYYPSGTEWTTQSIKIDGTTVTVEGGKPVEIYSDDGDVWTFGNPAGSPFGGSINRIIGRAEITFSITESDNTWFEGVCHKTEKLF